VPLAMLPGTEALPPLPVDGLALEVEPEPFWTQTFWLTYNLFESDATELER